MNNAEEGTIEMPIIRYHVHESFHRPRTFSNDIALIKLVLYSNFYSKKNYFLVLKNIIKK